MGICCYVHRAPVNSNLAWAVRHRAELGKKTAPVISVAQGLMKVMRYIAAGGSTTPFSALMICQDCMSRDPPAADASSQTSTAHGIIAIEPVSIDQFAGSVEIFNNSLVFPDHTHLFIHCQSGDGACPVDQTVIDRKSTRLNSSHL